MLINIPLHTRKTPLSLVGGGIRETLRAAGMVRYSPRSPCSSETCQMKVSPLRAKISDRRERIGGGRGRKHELSLSGPHLRALSDHLIKSLLPSAHR